MKYLQKHGNKKYAARRAMPLFTTGITLIETVVAVTILVAAIAGPMTLASQSLKASRDARNELIATHLAEEGIEVIHSVRDNNSGADVSPQRLAWMNSILSACSSGCVVNPTDHLVLSVWGPNTLLACPSGDCSAVKYLYYNPATGMYTQSLSALTSPWSKSSFTRVMTLQGIDDPSSPLRQVRVVSTVTYTGFAGGVRTVTVVDDLYNWFPVLK